MISFEWDDEKNKTNKTKHGISFEQARSVFYDELAIQFYDDKNSEYEDRFLLLGEDLHSRLLLICHCERIDKETTAVRIISARRATRKETKLYKKGN